MKGRRPRPLSRGRRKAGNYEILSRLYRKVDRRNVKADSVKGNSQIFFLAVCFEYQRSLLRGAVEKPRYVKNLPKPVIWQPNACCKTANPAANFHLWRKSSKQNPPGQRNGRTSRGSGMVEFVVRGNNAEFGLGMRLTVDKLKWKWRKEYGDTAFQTDNRLFGSCNGQLIDAVQKRRKQLFMKQRGNGWKNFKRISLTVIKKNLKAKAINLRLSQNNLVKRQALWINGRAGRLGRNDYRVTAGFRSCACIRQECKTFSSCFDNGSVLPTPAVQDLSKNLPIAGLAVCKNLLAAGKNRTAKKEFLVLKWPMMYNKCW